MGLHILERLRPAMGLLLALTMVLPSRADSFWVPVETGEEHEAQWVGTPRFHRQRGTMRLSFELSHPSDVEVAILDATGTVVRHWGAGLVGGHAPPPFRSRSLVQRLEWDGNNDLGQPAGDGPFQARIRLGSRPSLERIAGWNGQTLGAPILGLATGKEGEVFVLSGDAYRGRSEVRVFDAEGTYLRTILPYASAVPESRLASLGRLEIGGERAPVVFHAQGPALAPLTGGMRRQTMTVMPQGQVVVVSGPGSWFDHSGPRHLLALHPEGGAPEGMDFVGPMLVPPLGLAPGAAPGLRPAFDHVAACPDGRWIYLTLSSKQSEHAVFRVDLDQWNASASGQAALDEAFLGQRFVAGSANDQLNDPQGLATDAKGFVYVCDRGNDRVMVFSPDAAFLGKFEITSPEQIVVHPRNGAIYVLSRPRRTAPRAKDAVVGGNEAGKPREKAPAPLPKLVKFSPWRDAGVIRLAEIEGPFDLIAANPVASPPRLWASVMSDQANGSDTNRLRAPAWAGSSMLISVTDRVNTLSLSKPIALDGGLRHPLFIAADPARGRVLVREDVSAERDGEGHEARIVALNLDTDEIQPFINADEVAIGPDGVVYALSAGPGGGLTRYRATGEPWPFPVAEPQSEPAHAGSVSDPRRVEPRGLCVAPNGDLYVIRSTPWHHEAGLFSRVDVWSADGETKHVALVNGLGVADGGIGVDGVGNIYLGANVKPAARSLDRILADTVPDYAWLGWIGERAHRPFPWTFSMVNAYLYDQGAVLKFGPDGGAFYGRSVSWLPHEHVRSAPAAWSDLVFPDIAPESARMLRSGYAGRPVKVTGAQWLYQGMSPLPAADMGRFDAPGAGLSARLSVDPFGRVYVPDAFRFSVVVLDAAGNRLARIGRYGNADDQGPDIRFAWPASIDTADGKLYVSDSVNQRVSVIALNYTQEALLPLEP